LQAQPFGLVNGLRRESTAKIDRLRPAIRARSKQPNRLRAAHHTLNTSGRRYSLLRAVIVDRADVDAATTESLVSDQIQLGVAVHMTGSPHVPMTVIDICQGDATVQWITSDGDLKSNVLPLAALRRVE